MAGGDFESFGELARTVQLPTKLHTNSFGGSRIQKTPIGMTAYGSRASQESAEAGVFLLRCTHSNFASFPNLLNHPKRHLILQELAGLRLPRGASLGVRDSIPKLRARTTNSTFTRFSPMRELREIGFGGWLVAPFLWLNRRQ